MKKLMLLLILAVAALHAETSGVGDLINQTQNGTGAIVTGSPIYETGILKDWQAISILLALITLAVVALARMVADPLNIPELKAWANIEYAQVFVTVAIVISVVGIISFLDVVVKAEVNNSPGSPVVCADTDFCLHNVSNFYLDGLINLSNKGARDAFSKSIQSGATMSKRFTFSCGTLFIPPCFWGYVGWANNAFLLLDIERSNQEIEQYGSLIFSLSVQKFFVSNVAYFVGPVLLLIGIVARSFFLTRRIGGLMMATALGIMFVFPMMYLWNMITLNVTIYGDKLFATGNPECPVECGYTPEIAYKISDPNSAYNYSALFALTGGDEGVLAGLANGSLQFSGTAGSCEYIALHTNQTNAANNNNVSQYYCPRECRELPYPYIIPKCAEPKVELACMELPKGCKVVRLLSDQSAGQCGSGCDDSCKITPPLDGSTDCKSCFTTSSGPKPVSAPFNCRVALWRQNISPSGVETNSTDARPDSCLVPGNATYPNPNIAAVQNCKTSLDANESCTYVVPDIPDCECLAYNSTLPDYSECCISVPGISTCMEPPSVKYVDDPLSTLNPPDQIAIVAYHCLPGQDCLNYTGARFWNTDRKTCHCLGANCTSPSKRCNECLTNVSNDYCLFNPKVIPDCPDECANEQIEKPALLSPAEFAKRSGDSMFGREDVKNVSKLLIPAYLLPLINIAVTLMFIRSLSPILGGDIELPGYLKVL